MHGCHVSSVIEMCQTNLESGYLGIQPVLLQDHEQSFWVSCHTWNCQIDNCSSSSPRISWLRTPCCRIAEYMEAAIMSSRATASAGGLHKRTSGD